MAVDYDRMRATALRLHRENGRPVSLIPDTGAVASGGDPWDADVDSAALSVRALQTGFSRSLRAAGDVEVGDVMLSVAAADEGLDGAEPAMNWEVKDGDLTYRVVDVDVRRPGPVAISYGLHCRR